MRKLAALLTLMVVLTACGGGGRPSTDDIAKALKDEGNPNGVVLASDASDEAINCIAEALEDSDLSDDALQALVDGDSGFEGDKDDAKAIAGLNDDFAKCING
jgi:hypothetical protein